MRAIYRECSRSTLGTLLEDTASVAIVWQRARHLCHLGSNAQVVSNQRRTRIFLGSSALDTTSSQAASHALGRPILSPLLLRSPARPYLPCSSCDFQSPRRRQARHMVEDSRPRRSVVARAECGRAIVGEDAQRRHKWVGVGSLVVRALGAGTPRVPRSADAKEECVQSFCANPDSGYLMPDRSSTGCGACGWRSRRVVTFAHGSRQPARRRHITMRTPTSDARCRRVVHFTVFACVSVYSSLPDGFHHRPSTLSSSFPVRDGLCCPASVVTQLSSFVALQK